MRSTLYRALPFLALFISFIFLPGCPVPQTGPMATFSGSPTAGTAPLTVQFTDRSAPGSSPITTWSWNFGDGESGSGANPSHVYQEAGTYTVELTVTTTVGSDSESKSGYVTVGDDPGTLTPPTAAFSAAPTSGTVPLTVQFTDSSIAGSSPLSAWTWDFGDGASSNVANPAHTYTEAGSYSVTLTVTTADGSDSEFNSNFIAATSGTGVPPTAAFSANPTSGEAPLTVQFSDESHAGTSEIVAWAWDFGDGRTSDQPNPGHVYGEAGTYTVSLTVTTADGIDTETQNDLITAVAGATWAPDTTTFDVTLAPEVLRVQASDLENVIMQWNPDEHAYLLDKTATDGLGLTFTVGAPLILDGIEVGRISVLDISGTEVYLETEMIPLNEVFPDGEISWDYGVEFTADSVKSIEIPGVGEFAVKAGTPINITFDQGGYKYELMATLDGATATFDFTVTKGVGAGVTARFTAKGQIVRFRNKNQIRFSNGELTQFGHELNGMRGNTELKLVVAGSGSDALDFKLPVPIMKIPFVVGYIPGVLSIGAQFVVNAAVPLEGSAQVGTTFTYDSDLGFTFNGVEVSAGGRAGDTAFGNSTHMTGAASAISANFGIGFPRVSINIAAGTLVPWAQTAFLVGGSYTVTPACQTADAQFIGAAGYNFGILGFELASGSKTLFTQKKELLRAGDCPPSKEMDAMEAVAVWLTEDFPSPVVVN